MKQAIYLASASPRRKELLTSLGVNFEQFSVDADESAFDNEQPAVLVERLARLKAQSGVELGYQDRPVLGSDTIVVLNNQVLGKPKDKADGLAMLRALSNQTHQVMTAIALASTEKTISEIITTDVTFTKLTEQEIEDYWDTGEPLDKAGSYGIQGGAGRFVTNINGSYFAVVGLPLFETERLIKRFFEES